jgi:hypothetical protein
MNFSTPHKKTEKIRGKIEKNGFFPKPLKL